MKVRIVANPRRFPDHIVVMVFSRFESAMNERVAGKELTVFVLMLRRTADALAHPWYLRWEKLSPRCWGLHRAEWELRGLPPNPDLRPLAPIVEKCYRMAGVDDIEVEVAAA